MTEVFGNLMHAARAADWCCVVELTDAIRRGGLPQDADQQQEYVRKLSEALVVVKASRADLAMSAARLNAVAGFQSSGQGTSGDEEKRQDYGGAADL